MKYINKEKLEKIKLDKNNFYVAIDFDKTITTIDSVDSWDASGNQLGEEFKKKSYALYQKYAPIELDYSISFEEKEQAMKEWYYSVMNLFYEYHLTRKNLYESVKSSNLTFRKGAKEFLAYMFKNNIPVVILSAGIGNTIEQFLKNNKCCYENIYIISNFILFDKAGNMKKYNDGIIHTLSKTMEGHIIPELKEKIQDKEYRLLCGDLIEDKKMIPFEEWEKTLSIRIFRKKYRRKF